MSPEATPEAVRFDPESSELPAALEPAITDSTAPVLLLIAPDTGDEMARAAIGLADGRGARGLDTILADGAFQDPRLHTLLGVENLEGLADLFLFGASLERVRVRPEAHSFDFIPAGAYVPDPAGVLSSDQWRRVARTVEAEGGRLLLFISADAPGLGILSQRVGEAVLMGDARAVERIRQRVHPSCRVLAVVEPTSTMGPGRATGAAVAASSPDTASRFDEPDLTEPVVFRSDRKGQRAVSWVLIILLAAALIAAGWFLYREYLSTSPTPAPPVEEIQREPAAAVEEVPPEPVETPLPLSVQVEAHQDYQTAIERVAALTAAEPSLTFYLAPIAHRGGIFYRLLAGPVADRQAGERVMERLVEAGHKTGVDAWAIRPTEHAFLLGEFSTREGAAEHADTLVSQGIPVYVVPVRYDRGGPGYRVWGGAFQHAAEAAVMKDMLQEAGMEARLTVRTGEPVEGDA